MLSVSRLSAATVDTGSPCPRAAVSAATRPALMSRGSGWPRGTWSGSPGGRDIGCMESWIRQLLGTVSRSERHRSPEYCNACAIFQSRVRGWFPRQCAVEVVDPRLYEERVNKQASLKNGHTKKVEDKKKKQ